MSNFEFSRNLNIGQYLPLDSPIHRLDPRARILSAIFILGTAVVVNNWQGLAIGLIAVLIILGLAHIPLAYAIRGLLPPLPFLVIIGIIQIFFNPYKDTVPIWFTIFGDQISGGDFLAGGVLIFRFVVLILGLSLVSFSLSTTELTHGLEALLKPFERLGLPTYDFVMVIQVTLRFLPFLGQAAERIAKAQASRGGQWGTGRGSLLARARQVFPLIIPLFMISLHKAETMALAMDARGYGGKTRRTSMTELDFRLKDGIAICVAMLVSAAIIIV